MFKENIQTEFHAKLKNLMDKYAHFIYDITQNFPSEEKFGIVSQMRRSALSIILNYIEGYARKKKLVMQNFFETSYGSLKESKYLLYFSYKRKYISKTVYENGLEMAEEIGKMIWGILEKL